MGKTRLRKKSNRNKLMTAADKQFFRAIRARDQVCQRCGSSSALAPSHVLCKGKYPNLRYDLLNAKLLCFGCHIPWWHANPMEAAEWFIQKFPARWAYLENAKTRECWKTSDLPDIIAELKQKADELEMEAPHV